jgi:hypothetical protein
MLTKRSNRLVIASPSRGAWPRGEIAIYRIAHRNGADFLHVLPTPH